MKWFSRRHSNKTQPKQTRAQSLIEPLEGRQLLAAAVITSLYADNRGGIHIRFDKALQASTVTRTNVKVLLPGADQTLNTSDDVSVTANVSYQASKNTIHIFAEIPADFGYRVKLFAGHILGADGLKIDGEMLGHSVSGNGTPGGDTNFRVRRDTGATPRARISTSMGDIDVTLYRGDDGVHVPTPDHVALFLRYVNGGEWDNMFVTRNAKNFVTQLGGLRINSGGAVQVVPKPESLSPVFPTPVVAEPGNSNVRGSVAYALGREGPDSASNEFFFNLVNNNGWGTTPNLDNSSNGGPFTVFGRVNSHGLNVLDAINALHRLNLSNPFETQLGVDGQNVPVKNVTVTGENDFLGGTTTDSINPSTDFVVVSRAAVLMKIIPLP